MEEVGGKTNMEQNILKRYHEIHIKLWEEVAKVFNDRTEKSFEKFKTNTKLLNDFCLSDMKRVSVLNLFSNGYITKNEQRNLLANTNCSACYIALQMWYEENLICTDSFENRVNSCKCCPVQEWREQGSCDKYQVINERIYQLRDYIMKCINDKKEFNQEVYTSLRKDIMKKMYIVAHLEWGMKNKC